jgi:hypothetical protein
VLVARGHERKKARASASLRDFGYQAYLPALNSASNGRSLRKRLTIE